MSWPTTAHWRPWTWLTLASTAMVLQTFAPAFVATRRSSAWVWGRWWEKSLGWSFHMTFCKALKISWLLAEPCISFRRYCLESECVKCARGNYLGPKVAQLCEKLGLSHSFTGKETCVLPEFVHCLTPTGMPTTPENWSTEGGELISSLLEQLISEAGPGGRVIQL